jgi:hypothetical protein
MPAARLLQATIAGHALSLILQGRAEQMAQDEIRAWAEQAVTAFLYGYAQPAG